MALFSELFKPKVGNESKKTIELLHQWHRSHFPDNGYCYNGMVRYQNYRTESGEKIQLSQIRVPIVQSSQPKNFFEKIKTIAEKIDRPYLPNLLADYHDKVHQEISRFQAHLKKLNCLSANIKNDSLFRDIDHIFNSKLKILYNELLFCKFQNLGNKEYFDKMNGKFLAIDRDLKSLNTDFSNYMYALTNTEYENTKIDLAIIRTRVEAMSKVTGQYADECI